MDLWSILENELVRYRDCTSSIRQYLVKYEEICAELILRIGKKKFDDCQSDYDQLISILDKISIIIYKYDFKVNSRLNDFVYYMDRDDLASRKYWHKQFQEGMEWPCCPVQTSNDENES